LATGSAFGSFCVKTLRKSFCSVAFQRDVWGSGLSPLTHSQNIEVQYVPGSGGRSGVLPSIMSPTAAAPTGCARRGGRRRGRRAREANRRAIRIERGMSGRLHAPGAVDERDFGGRAVRAAG
jgi:hypothetical protein